MIIDTFPTDYKIGALLPLIIILIYPFIMFIKIIIQQIIKKIINKVKKSKKIEKNNAKEHKS